MFYNLIFFIAVLIILSKVIYKDMLCPTVLVGVPWLLSMLLLLYSYFEFDINSIFLVYFALGIFIFQIGYIVISLGKVRNVEKQYNDTDI